MGKRWRRVKHLKQIGAKYTKDFEANEEWWKRYESEFWDKYEKTVNEQTDKQNQKIEDFQRNEKNLN